MRKHDYCQCENKGADQLCSNYTADQHLCFCYTDSAIPLLPKSEISSFWPYSMTAQAVLCWFGFLASWLNYGFKSCYRLRFNAKEGIDYFVTATAPLEIIL